VASLTSLHGLKPVAVACDLHPDYLSTRYAEETGLPVMRVQHHFAHALAAAAENELDDPALAVTFDGTGYGTDGTVWGGEFLRIEGDAWSRVAHLRTFRLPGGEAAVREPRRAALGVLFEIFGADLFAMKDLRPVASFTESELAALKTMLAGGVNSPLCSSAGRLFDAVASLTGIRQVNRFEGQAAMELEFAADAAETVEAYPFEISTMSPPSPRRGEGRVRGPEDIESPPTHPSPALARTPSPGEREREVCLEIPQKEPLIIDWAPVFRALLEEIRAGAPLGAMAAKWHNTLVEMMVRMASIIGEERVVLSGGCFQNRILTETAVNRLRQAGFRPYWHQRIPPNDGGIALGQAAAATRARGA